MPTQHQAVGQLQRRHQTAREPHQILQAGATRAAASLSSHITSHLSRPITSHTKRQRRRSVRLPACSPIRLTVCLQSRRGLRPAAKRALSTRRAACALARLPIDMLAR